MELDAEYARMCAEECSRYREENFDVGHVRLHVDAMDTGPGARGSSKNRYEIWFDGDRLRFDAWTRASNGREWSEEWIIDGEKYWWFPARDDIAITAGRVSEYDDIYDHFGLFHPRWVGQGTNPESVLHRNPRARLPGENLPSALVEVSRVPLGDQTALRVVYETQIRIGSADSPKATGEGQIILWYVPDRGYSLARAEIRDNVGGHETVVSVESDLAQAPHTNVWYPTRVQRLRTFDGKVTRRETVTVEEAVFGNVDVQAISLAAMELSEGRKIFDRTEGTTEQTYVWSGDEAVHVPNPSQRLPEPQFDPPPAGGWRIFWIVNVFVLALITCLGLWRLLSTKPTHGQESR